MQILPLTPAMIDAPPLTPHERRQWTNEFQSHLAERLRWTITYVRQHQEKPARLKPYGDSLIAIIKQAWQQPQLARPVIDLILALHPLPERWGYWEKWEEVLQVGAGIASSYAWQRQQAELLAYQAHLLWSCNRCDEAVEVGRHALQLATALRMVQPASIAGAALVNSLSALGQIEESRELLTHLLKKTAVLRPTAAAADIDAAMLALDRSHALILRQQGKQEEATAVAHSMLKRAENKLHISPYQLGDTFVEQATMLWAGGDYPAAVNALQTAIRLFEQVEDMAAAVFARGNLGLVYWSMAQYDLAEQKMRECVAFCEQFNAHWRLISDVGNLALVYLGQGSFQQALNHVNRHLDLAQRYGHTWETSRARLNRGAILVYLQDYEAAYQELETSLERVVGESRRELIASVQIDLSLCYVGLGNWERARQLANNAYKMAEDMSFPSLKIIALRNLAQYGKVDKRKWRLQKALSLASQHHRLFDEAGCLFSLGGLTTDKAKQADYWQKAVKLLEKMGVAAWLENHSPENPPFLALML